MMQSLLFLLNGSIMEEVFDRMHHYRADKEQQWYVKVQATLTNTTTS
jgi:hypothetical protein